MDQVCLASCCSARDGYRFYPLAHGSPDVVPPDGLDSLETWRRRQSARVAALLRHFGLATLLEWWRGRSWLPKSSGGGSVLSRFMHSAYGDRMAMWTDAVRIALMHPLLGVGVGEYAAAQYWVTAAGNYTVGTPYAHNAILQLGAEFGVAAALYFTLLIGWWLLSRARQRWTDPRVSAVLMMGALLIVHGMLEWSLWVMFVSIPAALLFALGEPDSYRTIRISARSTLLPIGCAGLLYLPLIYVDFDSVARVGGRLVEEQQHNGGGSAESVVGVVEFGTATYFKPHADRMLLAVTPHQAPGGR